MPLSDWRLALPDADGESEPGSHGSASPLVRSMVGDGRMARPRGRAERIAVSVGLAPALSSRRRRSGPVPRDACHVECTVGLTDIARVGQPRMPAVI